MRSLHLIAPDWIERLTAFALLVLPESLPARRALLVQAEHGDLVVELSPLKIVVAKPRSMATLKVPEAYN